MHQVQLQLTDQLYDLAKRRAADAGFKTVEEYASKLLANDLHADTENYDHLFTPERIALLDRVAADVRAGGKTYTIEEVSAHLEETRANWIRKNGK